MKVLTVYGTRPEAIKLAPLIRAFESANFESVSVVSGQHKHMLAPVTKLFGLNAQHNLDIFSPGMGLNDLASRVIATLDPILQEEAPDAVIVQGDTTTSAAASLAAMYRGIRIVHLEAGLRSFDLRSPFPEEANRKITSHIADLHLAPTPSSKRNLLREGIDERSIHVTGNTVIDALNWVVGLPQPTFADPRITALLNGQRRFILITAHRRENWGAGMKAIADALASLAQAHPEMDFVIPAHPNPLVRGVFKPMESHHSNLIVTEPLDYLEFTHVMAAAHLVITDSGGVQEEAPSLGKPVLVMRDNTERPEAVEFGTVRLVGTEAEAIFANAQELLMDSIAYAQMATATNPYGDGQAAERSLAAINSMLGLGHPFPDYSPVADDRKS